MVEALGQEINEFYNTGFPDDAHTEETPEWVEAFFDEDEHLALTPIKKYDLSEFGYVIDSADTVRTFSAVFSEWQVQKDSVSLVVSVPKDKIDDFKKLIEAHPWAKIEN